MQHFTLITKNAATTIGTTFIAATFIATIFKSWMMKLKTLFDFSQLSSRVESRDYVAEATRGVGFSFPQTKVWGYKRNNLSYRVPKASLWEKRVSITRNVKWIPSFGGMTKRTEMTTRFVFLVLLVCLTSEALFTIFAPVKNI